MNLPMEVFDSKNETYKIWEILKHAFHEIYVRNASRFSLQELYRNNLVVAKNYGETLYAGMVTTMTAHLKEISKSIEAAKGDSFLEELNGKWNAHNEAQLVIIFNLVFVNINYTPHETPFYEMCQNLWMDNIIHSSKIHERLLDMLPKLVLKERTGEVVSQGLMGSITKMLMELGSFVYQEVFENPVLLLLAQFYQDESQKLIEGCDCGEYLKKVERHLNEERDRGTHYLHARTAVKITNVIENEMIAAHMLRLVNMKDSGLVNMLRNDKYEDMGRMYNLFRRYTNGLSTIREEMTSHLRKTGECLVTDPERLKDPVKFVQRLLDEKDKYDSIISMAFNNDRTFQRAFNSSFAYIVNLNPCLPEFISLFVDDKLCKGLKGVSDVEIILDKVMGLLPYLREKDTFEYYYRKHLAWRLFCCKTVSDDAERSLIVKLKTECGYHFTSKLECMFTDMKTSQDKMRGFYANDPGLGDGPTLDVQVLTKWLWPINPSIACNLPVEISALCENFRLYYLGTHTGRRLSWQTNMGTAVIEATFGKGQKHELNVSTYQMCVLMPFNNADHFSYKEIKQATKIPASDLKICLQLMACVMGKNVLGKDPMSEEIGEEDVFFVNEEFNSKLFKVDIRPVVVQKESEREKQEMRRRMEVDRQPQIEAAIVRIMKSRRVLDHNNIITDVTKQLQSRFLANPNEIKKRLESLIEREYLERDNNDRKLYRYLP